MCFGSDPSTARSLTNRCTLPGIHEGACKSARVLCIDSFDGTHTKDLVEAEGFLEGLMAEGNDASEALLPEA